MTYVCFLHFCLLVKLEIVQFLFPEFTDLKSPVGGVLEEKTVSPRVHRLHDSSSTQSVQSLLQVPQKGMKMSPSYEDVRESNHLSDSSESVNSSVDGDATKGEGSQELLWKGEVHKEPLQAQDFMDIAMKNENHTSLRATSSDPSTTSLSRTSVTIKVRKPSKDMRVTQSLDDMCLADTEQLQASDQAEGNDAMLPYDAGNQKPLRMRKRPILMELHKDSVIDESPTEVNKQLCRVDQSTGED